jgi:DNA-binding NarL/FixJ family response regulator
LWVSSAFFISPGYLLPRRNTVRFSTISVPSTFKRRTVIPFRSMTISVLLADDSPLMRKSIAYFLKDDPEIRVVAEAASFRQTIKLASSLHPQVIVMDLYMDDGGDETPSQIKSSLADSKILAISFANDCESEEAATSYGAVEVLDKTKLANEIIPAIKRCANE